MTRFYIVYYAIAVADIIHAINDDDDDDDDDYDYDYNGCLEVRGYVLVGCAEVSDASLFHLSSSNPNLIFITNLNLVVGTVT